jgi:hypothetical protein
MKAYCYFIFWLLGFAPFQAHCGSRDVGAHCSLVAIVGYLVGLGTLDNSSLHQSLQLTLDTFEIGSLPIDGSTSERNARIGDFQC